MYEHWKQIAGYEGVYSVSNLGKVRRDTHRSGRRAGHLVWPIATSHGYDQVGLCVNGRSKRWKLHQLVAEAFLGPCPDGYQINHKDGNKSNNRADNLEYVTPSENIKHGIRLNGRKRISARAVLGMQKRHGEGQSMPSLAKELGCSMSAVSKIINGKRRANVAQPGI